MKANDIPNIQHEISFANFENLFNVYKTEDDKFFYNLLKTVNVPEELDPEYYEDYVVKFGDMWPTIAYKFYGNVVLWWLVCTANQIQDPSGTPEVGKKLKIIKREFVTEILNKLDE